MYSQTQTTPNRKAATTEVTVSEVVAYFPSESKPDQAPHKTVLNRFTGKAICSCRGYSSRKHCKHQEALCAVALSEGLIRTVQKATSFTQNRKTYQAHPRGGERLAVIDDFNPFAEIDAKEQGEQKSREVWGALKSSLPELAEAIEAEHDALIARYANDQYAEGLRVEQVARFNFKSVGGGF